MSEHTQPIDLENRPSGERQVICEIILAEFNGLRGEVGARLALQITLVLANLTLTGVVFTINASSPVKPLVFLPLVSGCLAFFFFDQYRNFEIISSYIRTRTVPQLALVGKYSEERWLFSWEREVIDAHNSPKTSAPYGLALLFTFGLPIGLALYATTPWSGQTIVINWVFWILGVSVGLLAVVEAVYLGPRGKMILPDPLK